MTHGVYDMLPLGMAYRHVMYVSSRRRGCRTSVRPPSCALRSRSRHTPLTSAGIAWQAARLTGPPSVTPACVPRAEVTNALLSQCHTATRVPVVSDAQARSPTTPVGCGSAWDVPCLPSARNVSGFLLRCRLSHLLTTDNRSTSCQTHGPSIHNEEPPPDNTLFCCRP